MAFPPEPEAPAPAPASSLINEHVGRVIGDVLAEHAPKAAEAVAKATSKARETFLEELEGYNAEMMRPMIAKLRASGGLPAELEALLAEVQGPGAQVGSLLSSFFVYGVMFSLASTLLAPFMQETANTIWSNNPDRPLSPPDVANMVVQGYMTEPAGQTEANLSGIDNARFDKMVQVTGMPPSPQDLFQMFRRGIFEEGTSATEPLTVYGGLAQGHTKDEWITKFQQLAHVWPSPIDFVNAGVREQFATKAEAEAWAGKAGLDITTQTEIGSFFDVLFDVAGRPPGPEEAGRMANRKIIHWTGSGPAATTFQQAIAESDVKTKWTAALQALQAYVLPNGEITSLVRDGWLTPEAAAPFYENNGVDAGLQELLTTAALSERLEQDRLQTKATILSMYENRLLDAGDAVTGLNALGYHAEVVVQMLALADFRWKASNYTRIVQEIGRQVITGKVNPTNASASLAGMGVPAATVTLLLNDWQAAKEIEVPAITASQIASAVYYNVETPEQAMGELQALGYTTYDAWRLLSIRLHGKLDLPGGLPPIPPPPAL